MKLIIAGSRNFSDYILLKVRCKKFIAANLTKPDEQVIIVSGAANGADKLGERFAAENSYSILRFPADWNKFGKSAGYRRNVEMAEKATHCIIFRVGGAKSKGSTHMYNIAKSHFLITELVDTDDTTNISD